MCLGTKTLVQERVGNFLAGLASRKEEVKHRCRTVLQSRPRGSCETPSPILTSPQVHIPPWLWFRFVFENRTMRFDEIKYNKTLDYCDGILIFEAHDPIGGTYVACFLEAVKGGDKYLVVGCRPESLRLFRLGACDLRDLLQMSAVNGWYVADFLGLRRPLDIRRAGEGDIPDEFLPEPGYMIFDSEVNHKVAKDAVERNNFVLEVTIEPPGSGREGAVGMSTLNNLVNRINELARCAVGEVTDGRGRRNTGRLDVVGVSEGSVVVTLQGTEGLDERRESSLAKAFERLDSLFERMEFSHQLDAAVAEYAPATVEAYARLMKLLKDEKTGFQYTWAAPTMAAPSHRAVSLERTQTLESDLPKALERFSEETPAEEIVIQGTLKVANQFTGKWTLEDAQRVRWNGVVEKDELGLEELVIGRHYTFTCLGTQSRSRSGRKGKPPLTLQAISES